MGDKRHPTRPEWVPENAGKEYTSTVMKGVKGGHDGIPGQRTLADIPRRSVQKRRQLSVDEYIEGIRGGDRVILARAITLIESNAPRHMSMAQDVLTPLLPQTGSSIRIGITGVPGVGKSTFIEAFGSYLCELGKQVAVLAVDPSSTISGGSILGDKTRMEKLSHCENAFIRPSPAAGTLGGVARKSRETMLLCEAFGFDVILVETVGVGQSEVAVRSMVDFFLLLMLTGAGDELQGIKKGIIELADAMLINKADGDNERRAEIACGDYARALHYLTPATRGWEPQVHSCSALTRKGIPEVWEMIRKFEEQTREQGIFQQRREKQSVRWMHSLLEEYLKIRFFQNDQIRDQLPQIEKALVEGKLTPTLASQQLIEIFEQLMTSPGKG